MTNASYGELIYRKRLYENQGLPAIVNLIVQQHNRILDVGCGNGINMQLLRQRGHRETKSYHVGFRACLDFTSC